MWQINTDIYEVGRPDYQDAQRHERNKGPTRLRAEGDDDDDILLEFEENDIKKIC